MCKYINTIDATDVSFQCPRFLEQCLGYLFELVIMHGPFLLGSIVHQECFQFHLHFCIICSLDSFSSFSLFKHLFLFFKGFQISFQTLVTNNQTSGCIEICPVFLFSSASKLNRKCVSCLYSSSIKGFSFMTCCGFLSSVFFVICPIVSKIC